MTEDREIMEILFLCEIRPVFALFFIIECLPIYKLESQICQKNAKKSLKSVSPLSMR
jgi:hypothetical protein